MGEAALQLDLFSAVPLPAASRQLTVLSYGGGQDSWAILCKLVFDQDFRAKYAPGDLLVVMADTRDEHPETTVHIEYTKLFCLKHGIEFVHITADMGYHSPKWHGLREFYRATNTVGSKAFPKTCTDRLKLQPIYRFLEEWLGERYQVETGKKKGFRNFAARNGRIKMLIGIAKGEESRMADHSQDPVRWRRESIEILYPLVDIGYDRKACQDYPTSIGEPVPPPSNCILCPFMGDIELLWLYRFRHDDYLDWVQIEQNKLDANRHMDQVEIRNAEGVVTKVVNRNLGVWGNKTLPVKMNEVLQKYGHMSDSELREHKFSHGHCVMSKY